MERMKRCTKCHKLLPETDFYVRRDNGTLQSQCKNCCKAHGRLRNGTTGVYKKENEQLNLFNMVNEDITKDITMYFSQHQHCFHFLLDNDNNRQFGDDWTPVLHGDFETCCAFEDFCLKKVLGNYECLNDLCAIYDYAKEFKHNIKQGGTQHRETTKGKNIEESNMGLKSSVEIITPQIARDYLVLNIVNRPLNKKKVIEYADAMLKGQWQLNGEPICFDVSGKLVNGQHRLHAVIKAFEQNKDISFPTLVVRGVSKDSFITYDSGANRKLGDIFYLSDIPNYSNVASIINRVFQWRKGSYTLEHRDRSSLCTTKQDCLNEYKLHPDFYQKVCVFSKRLYKETKLLKQTEIGAMYAWLVLDKHHPEDIVANFFELLCTVSNCSCNAILLLRQRLIRDKSNVTKMPSQYKYMIIAKTWNAYIQGKNIKSLRWNESLDGYIDFI